jgi:hypothetical protein
MGDDNITPDERLTMVVMLGHVVRYENEKTAIEAQRRDLDLAWAEAERRRASAVTSFGAFGFNPADKDLWNKVRELMGDDAWYDGLELGGREVVRPPKEVPLFDIEHADYDVTEADVLDPEDQSLAIADQMPDGKPTVRELVLSQLAEAGENGTKAAAIRKFIEKTYGHTLHEKTVGMTLYRLSKDRLARRVKRTWFSAQPPAETENPGGDTPGSKESIFG